MISKFPLRHISEDFQFSFSWLFLLKIYLTDSNRPYACKHCSVKYYRKYQLVKHLSSKHPGVASADIDEESMSDEDEFDADFQDSQHQVKNRIRKRTVASESHDEEEDEDDDEYVPQLI